MTFNPTKLVTDGNAGASALYSDAIARKQATPPQIMTRGVVIEIFHDTDMLTPTARENWKAAFKGRIQNPNALNGMRRNCLLVRELSQKDTGPLLLCLPLFDPYICIPFKPGEIVLLLREDAYGAQDEIPFVLCRVPTQQQADDVNYTHDDRKYLPTKLDSDAVDSAAIQPDDVQTQQAELAAKGRSTVNLENFDNGGPNSDSFTFGRKKQMFDIVWRKAVASEGCILEPVPRFRKLPGDQTLQGSNNNLINFTIDRQNLSHDEVLGLQRGAIDIVVGRGFTPELLLNEKTAPNVVFNTRNAVEVDKTPHFRQKEDVVTEGDPDFTNDPSRIYIAMKSDVDKRFGIDIKHIDEAPPIPPERKINEEVNKPGIVLKTTQLRLIGREDVKIQADNGDGNGAAIVLKANGDIILVPGPQGHIMLGGTDAGIAPLCSTAAKVGGNAVTTIDPRAVDEASIEASTITDTATGVHGIKGQPTTGQFATKVLMK